MQQRRESANLVFTKMPISDNLPSVLFQEPSELSYSPLSCWKTQKKNFNNPNFSRSENAAIARRLLNILANDKLSIQKLREVAFHIRTKNTPTKAKKDLTDQQLIKTLTGPEQFGQRLSSWLLLV